MKKETLEKASMVQSKIVTIERTMSAINNISVIKFFDKHGSYLHETKDIKFLCDQKNREITKLKKRLEKLEKEFEEL